MYIQFSIHIYKYSYLKITKTAIKMEIYTIHADIYNSIFYSEV